MLFLDALPHATLYEWDLGDMDYSAKNAALFSRIYAGRFHYYRGDSAKTVRNFITNHPNHKCDVVFVDGCKGIHGRLYDVRGLVCASRHAAHDAFRRRGQHEGMYV